MKKKLLFLPFMVAALFSSANAMKPTKNNIIKSKIDIFESLPSDIVSYIICNFLTPKKVFQILFVNKNYYKMLYENLKQEQIVTLGKKGLKNLQEHPKSVIENIKQFKRIKIEFNNLNLKDFSFEPFQNLESVTIENCKNIDFKDLNLNPNLKTIYFRSLNLKDFSFEPLKNLESVTISICESTDFEGLNPNLKTIHFWGLNLKDFKFKPFKNLESVTISICESTDLEGLNLNPNLKTIYFRSLNLKGFKFESFQNLESVKINECENVSQKEISRLKRLGIEVNILGINKYID